MTLAAAKAPAAAAGKWIAGLPGRLKPVLPAASTAAAGGGLSALLFPDESMETLKGMVNFPVSAAKAVYEISPFGALPAETARQSADRLYRKGHLTASDLERILSRIGNRYSHTGRVQEANRIMKAPAEQLFAVPLAMAGKSKMPKPPADPAQEAARLIKDVQTVSPFAG